MIQEELAADEAVLTLSTFPRLGPTKTTNVAEQSLEGDLNGEFVSGNIMTSNQRVNAVISNITARRERPFKVKVPIFHDTETPWPWNEALAAPRNQVEKSEMLSRNLEDNHIYGDSLVFGPSCCGFQVTFQTQNMHEALMLHDQLCPVGPIIMALTAATPFFRGYLTNTDVQWNQATVTVDDRTVDEVNTDV